MNYQLEYDKCLNACGTFLYQEKNELLSGVALWLRFAPVFYGEIRENFEQQIDVNGEMRSLSGLVKVGYDNQSKVFSFQDHEVIKDQYEIGGYTKDVVEKVESELTKELTSLVGFKAPMSDAVMIEKEEFDFIISTYGHLFENDKGLQCLAYGWHEVTK